MNNKNSLLAIFLSHALHLFNFSFIKKEVNKRKKKSLKNIEPYEVFNLKRKISRYKEINYHPN